MTDSKYYADLVNPMEVNSASDMAEAVKRQERIEKGRAAEGVNAMINSPLFIELQKQTKLNLTAVVQQERQILELKDQNTKLEAQLELLKKSEEASAKRAKWSIVGFIISTAIALASLIVAVIALIK